MAFDLLCQSCGRRMWRWWSRGEPVAATYCAECRQGMSVVGIAFFAAPAPASELPATASAA